MALHCFAPSIILFDGSKSGASNCVTEAGAGMPHGSLAMIDGRVLGTTARSRTLVQGYPTEAREIQFVTMRTRNRELTLLDHDEFY